MANFGFVGIILTGIAEFIHLIGFAAPFWVKYGSVNYGLWQVCGTRCISFSTTVGWLKAVRAFAVLAFLALIGALVLGILRVSAMKDKKMIPMLAMVACLAAGAMIFLAVAIYGGEAPYKGFHFAYVFEIFAMLASFAAGAVHFMSMRQIV